MPNVFDVAAYILEKVGHTTAMKLQKLVYYSQAWSLVWDEAPMYDEPIEAWANGPVVRPLYEQLRGKFQINSTDLANGNAASLNEVQKATIDRVLDFYGNRDPQWLSDLTHMEEPWLSARAGIPPGVRTNAVISHACMAEYYGSLS